MIKKIVFLMLILMAVIFPAHADFCLPDHLTVIEEEAFANNAAISGTLVIPEGVTVIGKSAFSGCTGLTGLILPDSVIVIEDHAFSGCANLSVVFYADGRSISDTAFEGCKDVRFFSAETPTADFSYTVSGGGITITQYTGSDALVRVPERIEGLPVTGIGARCFYNNQQLEAVYLPAGTEIIGIEAFRLCSALKAVYGTENVLYYGDYAFESCGVLSSISFSSNLKEIGGDCFMACPQLNETLVVNESATVFDSAFSRTPMVAYCVSEEGSEAKLVRVYCDSPETEKPFVIPDSYNGLPITSIGSEVFSYSNSNAPKYVVLPSTVLRIEDRAFAYCENMVSISLPESLVSIGTDAFTICKKLDGVVLPEGLQYLGDSAFSYSGITSINIPRGITKIPAYCFSMSNLRHLVIPEHVTAIEKAALSSTKLKSIVIPGTVTEFGDYLLSECTELTSVTLPSNMTYLPDCSFASCTSLTSIVLPDSLTSIGKWSFSGCTSLTNVSIPKNAGAISECVFRDSGIRAQAIERIIAEVIKPGMTEFEKALALHDWIVNNARYDGDSPCFFGAEGVMVFGRGVCQSYMDAYRLLLDEVGIANYIISGIANGGSHTWNLVRLDNEWYHIDPTWDDPLPNGNEHHRYFGLTDDMISEDHYNWCRGSFPAANGTRYRYGVDNNPTAPTAVPGATPAPLPTPAPTPNLPESSEADFEYAVSDGEATITRYTGTDSVVVIPALIGAAPVTKIGANAFIDNDNVETVSLPLTVNAIEMQAFYSCDHLKTVYGTQNVTYYGDFAFSNCASLSSIYFSDRIYYFGYHCFWDCASLTTELHLPSDSPLITAYDYGQNLSMFFFSVDNGEAKLTDGSWGGDEIWTVSVPSYYRGLPVTIIGEEAFYWDQYIGGLILPDTVKIIETLAFCNCPNLTATISGTGIVIHPLAFSDTPGVTIQP